MEQCKSEYPFVTTIMLNMKEGSNYSIFNDIVYRPRLEMINKLSIPTVMLFGYDQTLILVLFIKRQVISLSHLVEEQIVY